MHLRDFIHTDIEPAMMLEFRKHSLKDNMKRVRIFAIFITVFDLILAASDTVTYLLRVDGRFEYSNYLVAYLSMILVNVLLLAYIRKVGDIAHQPAKTVVMADRVVMAYFLFILCWGSLVSLMDQELYGHLTVFMINLIIFSTLFFIEFKKLVLPFSISSLILFAGLPFFQKSTDVLIGHFINLLVFITVSFISSRIIYHNYCHDYVNKVMIEKMHSALHKLSYLDDLTHIPNRRSLNNYIESNYLGKGKSASTISVIMIDIDLFKQFNDRYGHVEGDRVLVEVAEQISISAEETGNFAARIGGEEFIYITENQSIAETVEIAENLRGRIMDLKIPHASSVYDFLSISLGISRITLVSEEDIYKCIELADKALYKAKGSGRNCLRTADTALVS